MKAHRTAAIAAAVAVLGLVPGQRLAAQMRTSSTRGAFSATMAAGPSMPVDQLAKITDTGAALGADVAYSLTNWLALTADGDVDFLTGHALEPDMRLWHYGGGLEVELAPNRTPWSVQLDGGANATTMDTSPFGGIDNSTDFTHTYFGLDGGLEVGYNVSRNVDVAVRGSGYFVFANKTDTQSLVAGSGVQPFSTAVTIPVTAELHIALPNG